MVVWVLSSKLIQPLLVGWGGVNPCCMSRLDQVMGATGTLTCVPPPHVERPEVDSKSFTQHLSRICFLHCSCCCFMLFQGRKTGPGSDLRPGGSGIRKRQCHSAIICFYLDLLGSSAPTLQERLEYKDPRAKCILRNRKKMKKLFPSVEPKAALLLQNFLFSVLQNRMERAGMQTMPAQREKITLNSFFYNMYRAHCKPVPQIQNTQQYLKTNRNRDRPLASPHRSVGGHNQAEVQSHPLGGGDSG